MTTPYALRGGIYQAVDKSPLEKRRRKQELHANRPQRTILL